MGYNNLISIVEMIESDAKNRFRNIVSSKVLYEWEECELSRSPLESLGQIVVENHVGGFKC
jgi:hypothetical protein